MYFSFVRLALSITCFFFNVPSTTEIYTYVHTLSLHVSLPISRRRRLRRLPYSFCAGGIARCWTGSCGCGWRRQRARSAARCRLSTSTGSRSEEHTSELQSLMRISYAVFCLTKKNTQINNNTMITYKQKQHNNHKTITKN